MKARSGDLKKEQPAAPSFSRTDYLDSQSEWDNDHLVWMRLQRFQLENGKIIFWGSSLSFALPGFELRSTKSRDGSCAYVPSCLPKNHIKTTQLISVYFSSARSLRSGRLIKTFFLLRILGRKGLTCLGRMLETSPFN